MTKQQKTTSESDLPAGLSQPAQRALAGAGIARLEDLTRIREDELKQLHGIGPKAVDLLTRKMQDQGLSFAGKTDKP